MMKTVAKMRHRKLIDKSEEIKVMQLQFDASVSERNRNSN